MYHLHTRSVLGVDDIDWSYVMIHLHDNDIYDSSTIEQYLLSSKLHQQTVIKNNKLKHHQ